MARRTLFVFGLVAILSMPSIALGGDALENGRVVFEEYCAACHGFDGIKQIAKAPSFAKGENLDKPDEVLLRSIREGKGEEMPAWNGDLDEQEMKDTLAYIRTLSDGG